MSWQINFGGATLSERDVTAAHLSVVGEIIGEHVWANVNPMHSPRTLAAWVTLCAMQAAPDEQIDVVLAYVASRPMHELVDACVTVDDPSLQSVPEAQTVADLFARKAV